MQIRPIVGGGKGERGERDILSTEAHIVAAVAQAN